jgi:hypothetical protein
MATITTLRGFSGATVTLEYEDGEYFVRKCGNIASNLQGLHRLATNGHMVPTVYSSTPTSIDMQYIPGIDIASYTLRQPPLPLIEFIVDTLAKFESTTGPKSYYNTYQQFLSTVDLSNLPFTSTQLLDRLPSYLPQTGYHGDFTLENIIYSTTNNFVLLDPATNQWDSIAFDIAKIRQDIDGFWFIRHNPQLAPAVAPTVLQLKQAIAAKYSHLIDDYLYILMLLRVFRHATPHTLERNLITQEITRLWK